MPQRQRPADGDALRRECVAGEVRQASQPAGERDQRQSPPVPGNARGGTDGGQVGSVPAEAQGPQARGDGKSKERAEDDTACGVRAVVAGGPCEGSEDGHAER